MFDFGAEPPEIISGLIYAGPGPGGLQQAATAWQELSQELEHAAVGYRSALTSATDVWQGPSATAMLTAAAPYILWMHTTALQAANVGTQAQAAAAAASAVKAAVVPPPIIAANRAQLMSLVATNILGQNFPAIAATEVAYEAMWAQDSTAMNAYGAASQSATSAISPFTPPSQVANPLAPVQQAAAPAAVSAQSTLQDLLDSLFGNTTTLGQNWQALVSSGFPFDVASIFSNFIGPIAGSAAIAGQIAHQTDVIGGKPSAPMANYPPPSPPAPKPPEVKAQAATGGRIGPMRVPPSWAQPQQEQKVAQPLAPTPEGGKDHPIGLPVIPAVPVTGGKGGQKKGSKFEDMDYGEPVPPILNRHPSGG